MFQCAEGAAGSTSADPRNGAANRYCANIIRDAEVELNWAKHKLANSE